MKRIVLIAILCGGVLCTGLGVTLASPQTQRCYLGVYQYGTGYGVGEVAATDNAWQDAAQRCGSQGMQPGHYQVVEVEDFGNGIFRVKIKMCCVSGG